MSKRLEKLLELLIEVELLKLRMKLLGGDNSYFTAVWKELRTKLKEIET